MPITSTSSVAISLKKCRRLPNELLSELVDWLPMAQFIGGPEPPRFGASQMCRVQERGLMRNMALIAYMDRARHKYQKMIREKKMEEMKKGKLLEEAVEKFTKEKAAELGIEAAALEKMKLLDAAVKKFSKEKTDELEIERKTVEKSKKRAHDEHMESSSLVTGGKVQRIDVESVENQTEKNTFSIKFLSVSGTKPTTGIVEKYYAQLEKTATEKSQQQVMSLEDAATTTILKYNPTELYQIRIAFETVRRALYAEDVSSVDKVIQLGFPYALVQALNFADEKVQVDAVWSIAKIVAGNSDHTMAMVKVGAIGPLIKLCESPSPEITEKATLAALAIGNLANDSAIVRDLLISEGILPVLIGFADRLSNLNPFFVQMVAFIFCNLCSHNKPQLALTVLQTIVPTVGSLIKHKDPRVQCWGLHTIRFITDGSGEHIGIVYNLNITADLINFINSGNAYLIFPALRILGNFLSGSNDQAKAVLDAGLLNSAILQFLVSDNTDLGKVCCWLVSKILAGSSSQIDAIIEAQLLPVLWKVLQNGDSPLKGQVSLCIANLCRHGTANQIVEIARVETGIEAICNCLSATENDELIFNLLNSLHALLYTLSQTDPQHLKDTLKRVNASGGVEILKSYINQRQETEEIHSVASKIINEFFTPDDAIPGEVFGTQSI